jgi:ABC-type dipeptide/oligopeptide/nickel transport system ATPase component
MGLLERPGRIANGIIRFRGDEISGLDRAAMEKLRGKKISMIFQDPLTSLNPLFTVKQQLVETIQAHLGLGEAEAGKRAVDLIRRVGIPNPEQRANQYPHQFSGGMRQRVVIALALCSEPDVIIADEPTTALDVSIQAQILDLIKELTRERQVGVILITHDMGVIADTTDVVTVMYQGAVVESGPTAEVLGRPQHPYTKSLIAAVPRPHREAAPFPADRLWRPGDGVRHRGPRAQLAHGYIRTGRGPDRGRRDHQALRVESRDPALAAGVFHRRRWREVRDPAGRGLRPRRRKRFGQVHHRADDRGALPGRWWLCAIAART